MIVIGAVQQTPEERLDGDDLEVLPTGFVSPDWPGHAVGFQAEIGYAQSSNSRKHRISIADVAHFRIGKKRIVLIGVREGHHLLWVRNINWAQYQCRKDAEDDDVGSDPERQGEDRSEGKAGRTAHLA